MTDVDVKEISPVAGIRFPVASRPYRRFADNQTVNNLAGPVQFQPIQLPASGFVRRVRCHFSQTWATNAGGAIVGGDAPWNLITNVTLTDATGQPVTQPLTGYQWYLVNKYLPTGTIKTNHPRNWNNPHMGPEFAYAVAAGTTGTANFRLDLDFEQDYNSGYGCIPNLDSNASLQLRIGIAAAATAFAGGVPTAAQMALVVQQDYWAPVAGMLGGQPVNTQPVGFGDFVETRAETGQATAAAVNLLTVTNRGGLIKGMILVSRAAGARVPFAPGSNVDLIVDNIPQDEGCTLESHNDMVRRTYGYVGADIAAGAAAYAPLGAGVTSGLDTGVIIWPFYALSGGRETWLNTRVGSQVQVRVTPGAAATQTEFITQLGQIRSPEVFYASSALD
ncbi:MAG TPA: hypothetical protein VJ553_00625 [Candidatus Paceibacterota bacterium]|nr:hypothetical protein [Candidatus Paceibacterota bacterium]